MRMMIFGAGYSGKAIGRQMAAQGAIQDIWVGGTSRSADKAETLREAGLQPYIYDGQVLSDDLAHALTGVTHLVQSIAPGRDGDPLIRLFGENGLRDAMPKLEWLCYLSTVGVYGDHDGAWVNEETALKPVSVRSVERVEAETAWIALAEREDLPLAILRLSGIYGPGRNTFINLTQGTARRLVKKDQVFNRIRVEDIASATAFLAVPRTAGVFNVTDDMPSPPQDVVSEAARLMGIDAPAEQSFETADLTSMARSFYGENKRVSNAKIKALGFDFHFPNYYQSLEDLLSSGRWNKPA